MLSGRVYPKRKHCEEEEERKMNKLGCTSGGRTEIDSGLDTSTDNPLKLSMTNPSQLENVIVMMAAAMNNEWVSQTLTQAVTDSVNKKMGEM